MTTTPGTPLVVPPARITFDEAARARVLALVDRSLQTGSLTLGPVGEAFEVAFAARHRATHGIATSSGTAALEIALRASGIGTGPLQGAEVVVPANTFFATAAAVVHAGGQPRLADVDPATLCLSAATVEAALTPATRAVVVVHIGGLLTRDLDAIARLCAERSLLLVEDAAHAHGSSLDGRPAGSWGRVAAWSFYPTKVVAGAEGGMITTGDDALAAEARIYRDQGKAGFFGGEHVRMGYAWRMSEVQAAVAAVHFEGLDDAIAVRRRAADRYREALAGVAGLTLLDELPGAVGCRYKLPALLDPGVDRAALKAALRDRHGVGLAGEVYARALHQEPVFAHLGRPGLEVAADVCCRHVCLPVHSDMTDAEVDLVVAALVTELAAR
ncbi:MAG TPA: DegT/DnrJ/EryC1/StrS family aminotransferase [Acidimicrobiales bacterium]|nr:DegT/DnrJ/EryC1/StrS family aminotransferase [Acidimicrobiales bacterium]